MHQRNLSTLRILVAIASYGEKNLPYVTQLIRQYQRIGPRVDVVVLSEAFKTLPEGARLLVGLPSRNPWSLPFAHKPLFARNVDNYDLFIYSEDDINVTEATICAFLSATSMLREDEIAGFLRYEVDNTGTKWMPDVHGHYHWQPESVVTRAGSLFAQYTNEHSAFYILTSEQLRRAVASGGFLRAPYEGKYDMLCSAATDPYTSCGFRRMVSVSDLPSFLVHHMSNRYTGQLGIPLTSFLEQLKTLQAISGGAHPSSTLCSFETKASADWSKNLYELADRMLLDLIPSTAKTILSVGCGWGATESVLLERGASVTGLPIDSVIGGTAAKRGVHIVYGDLQTSFSRLSDESFDCVFFSNILHLQADPKSCFSRAARLLRKGGTVLVSSPNFDCLGTVIRRLRRTPGYVGLRSFPTSGITLLRPELISRLGVSMHLNIEVYWANTPARQTLGRLLPIRATATSWVLRASRPD